MIRLTCPTCQSRLNAKEELAGQTRKCPKCGKPLLIPNPGESPGSETQSVAALDDPAPEQHVVLPPQEELPHLPVPERLDRHNRYLICDKDGIIAVWQNNGQGWMVKTPRGLVSAARNPERLAAQGNFVLVELSLGLTDAGLRLQGIHVHKLADRWVLTTLNQGDDRIVHRIVAPGALNRQQKAAVRKYLAEAFMHEVWHDSNEVVDYLSNTDFHSPGTPYKQPTR